MPIRSIEKTSLAAPPSRKIIICSALLLALCLGFRPPTARADEIKLETGATLTITEIQHSRVLPHAFYDQALSSLPHVYPEHTLLASRRVGNLGDVS